MICQGHQAMNSKSQDKAALDLIDEVTAEVRRLAGEVKRLGARNELIAAGLQQNEAAIAAAPELYLNLVGA
jgi:hypothetical protein